MKSAKLFLTGMYIHLGLSIAVPVGIFFLCADGWDTLGIGLLLFYLVMIAAVQIAGWVCAAMAVMAYRKKRGAALRSGWKLLKLWSIPFYVLNFLYSFLAWFVLAAASRGIFLILVPIPVIITCVMIVQSGCVGICYIMHLRKQPEHQGKPGGVHYILQLLPMLDILSTVLLLRKYRSGP